MKNLSILVVEDEKLHRITLRDSLSKAGYQVTAVEDGIQGLAAVEAGDFKIALVDLNLPKLDGLSFMKRLKKLSPETTVIIMTAYGSVESAITAMKAGAHDYITKPFITDDLLLTVKKVLQLQQLRTENTMLHKQLDERFSLDKMIGKSVQMQKVFNLIETVAGGAFNVLIVGETGTGKELVAQAIHRLSARKLKPFVPLNCAVLPDTLLESELFGYEKGAFTGAFKQKKGRFELANHGTLFLDDMDDMAVSAQVKLLRVLQERKFERLGGTETIAVDVRLITATKVGLADHVRAGKFREDLFYRLNVVPIILPPLRERVGDIPVLVTHFIKKFCKESGRPSLNVSPEAMRAMIEYRWSGNVRELENTVERLVALSSGCTLELSDLPAEFSLAKECIPITVSTGELKSLASVTHDIENSYIRKVLTHTGGKKTEAARILGISRKTLWEKLKQLEEAEE